VLLFVFDDEALSRPIASPDKVTFLMRIAGLTSALRNLGGILVERRGRLVGEVAAVAAEVGAERCSRPRT